MKHLYTSALIILVALITFGCSTIPPKVVVDETIRFTPKTFYYADTIREIEIEFDFLVGADTNKRIKERQWWLGLDYFETNKDARDFFLYKWAEKVDIALVVYGESDKPKKSEIDRIALNYKNRESQFEYQNPDPDDNQPWSFTVPYPVNHAKIFVPKSTAYAVLEMKYEDDNGRMKTLYSEEAILEYDEVGCCDSPDILPILSVGEKLGGLVITGKNDTYDIKDEDGNMYDIIWSGSINTY